MSVLSYGDIEDGDFSEALPAIADKVLFLVNSLRNTGYSDNILEREGILGLGSILMDVEEDLRSINEALYPSNSPTSDRAENPHASTS